MSASIEFLCIVFVFLVYYAYKKPRLFGGPDLKTGHLHKMGFLFASFGTFQWNISIAASKKVLHARGLNNRQGLSGHSRPQVVQWASKLSAKLHPSGTDIVSQTLGTVIIVFGVLQVNRALLPVIWYLVVHLCDVGISVQLLDIGKPIEYTIVINGTRCGEGDFRSGAVLFASIYFIQCCRFLCQYNFGVADG